MMPSLQNWDGNRKTPSGTLSNLPSTQSLLLWLDAEAISGSHPFNTGDPVEHWLDRSVSQNHATSSDSASTTYVIDNGHPAINVTGSSSRFTHPSNIGADQCAVTGTDSVYSEFVVARPGDIGTFYALSTTDGHVLYIADGNDHAEFVTGGGTATLGRVKKGRLYLISVATTQSIPTLPTDGLIAQYEPFRWSYADHTQLHSGQFLDSSGNGHHLGDVGSYYVFTPRFRTGSLGTPTGKAVVAFSESAALFGTGSHMPPIQPTHSYIIAACLIPRGLAASGTIAGAYGIENRFNFIAGWAYGDHGNGITQLDTALYYRSNDITSLFQSGGFGNRKRPAGFLPDMIDGGSASIDTIGTTIAILKYGPDSFFTNTHSIQYQYSDGALGPPANNKFDNGFARNPDAFCIGVACALSEPYSGEYWQNGQTGSFDLAGLYIYNTANTSSAYIRQLNDYMRYTFIDSVKYEIVDWYVNGVSGSDSSSADSCYFTGETNTAGDPYSEAFSGSFRERIVFGRYLSGSEAQAIRQYLITKHNLPWSA